METMQAVRIHSYGHDSVLSYEQAPRPEPKENDVLIRVHAASVNPVDWKIREGWLAAWFNHQLPLILGCDASGTVAALGPGVTGFSVGDEVFARSDVARDGTYAEYVSIPGSQVGPKPKTLDHLHAAAVPQAASAAWNALITLAELSAGQTVLIHAAAGGVGSFAVQFAKIRGARVIGTASAHNAEFLTGLGVDQVIDYNTTPFEDVVRDVDVVLDNIGGDTLQRSWKVLRQGGILTSLVEPPSPEQAAEYGVRAAFASALVDQATLAEFASLIDSGKVKPIVTNIFPLQEIHQAHALSESMHSRGKIGLQVAN